MLRLTIYAPGRHYVKWHKPDAERKNLRDFTYMWNLTKSQIHRGRIDQWLPRWRGGESGEILGTKLQVRRINKSRDLMYRRMTIVNNTVLNTGNMLGQ